MRERYVSILYIYWFPVLLVKSGLAPSRFQSKPMYVFWFTIYCWLDRPPHYTYQTNSTKRRNLLDLSNLSHLPWVCHMTRGWCTIDCLGDPNMRIFLRCEHGDFRLSDPADDLLVPFMAGYVRFPCDDCDDCDDHPWPGGSWWILYASPSDIGVYLYGLVKS